MRIFTHYFQTDNIGLRWRTLMQFGTSFEPIGTVVMKNPGSATFKDGECQNITDERLLSKLSKYNDSGVDEIDSSPWYEFSADATMNCVKNMFEEYYYL